MPTGYRGIIIAAVGWLVLTGQHPNPAAQTEQAQAQSREANALENIATTYYDEAERADRTPKSDPCGPYQYGSNAELCAEWKSADATADAARWASWATYLSAVSLLFVVIAIYLTVVSNRIARNSAERQLRSYMSIEPKGIYEADAEGHVEVPVWLKNAGQTPAYRVKVDSWFTIAANPRDFNPNLVKRHPPEVAESEVMFAPGETAANYIRLPLSPTKEQMAEIAKKESAILHFGYLSYEDAFGIKRTTNFAHYHWGEELSDAEARRCRLGNHAD